MAEIAEVAKRVRQHWLSQGLRVSSIEPEELVELRHRSQGIPDEYETLLRIAGLPAEEDREGFRFWRPQEIRPTVEVLAEAGYESDATEPSVIIADYLQESWWYGLWLAGPFAGQVSVVLGRKDGSDPQPPLGPLVDFLLAYVHGDALLYPPASSPEPGGPGPSPSDDED